ncbi:MAG: efflux RND transporter periplasmic adaptor subunit [Verrucomicrobiota bacterium]
MGARTRKFGAPGGLLLGAALCLAGCGLLGEGDQKPKVTHRVTTSKAQLATVDQYLEEIGNIVALEVVNITPQVSGKIIKIHFTDGQEVQAGDALFTIDPRPYEAQLAQAEASLARSEAELELNRMKLDRSRDLVPQDYLSPQDFDQLKTEVATSEASVLQNKAEIAEAKLNLDYCYIKSPIDGKTGVRKVDIGNVVEPSNQDVLLTIQRLDPVYVDFTVTESKLNLVRKYEDINDLDVEVTVPDNADLTGTAKLYFVDNAIDPQTGTVLMRGIMQNQARRFWPGQFVRVKVLLRRLPNSVLIPQGAVQISQDGTFVYTVNSSQQAEKRMVRLGQRQGKNVVVEDGVTAGEAVITTGQIMLAPGMQVQVIPTKPTEPKTPGPGASPLGNQPGRAVNVDVPDGLDIPGRSKPKPDKPKAGPQPPSQGSGGAP